MTDQQDRCPGGRIVGPYVARWFAAFTATDRRPEIPRQQPATAARGTTQTQPAFGRRPRISMWFDQRFFHWAIMGVDKHGVDLAFGRKPLMS